MEVSIDAYDAVREDEWKVMMDVRGGVCVCKNQKEKRGRGKVGMHSKHQSKVQVTSRTELLNNRCVDKLSIFWGMVEG